MFDSVKEVLTKEVDVKEFLEMEIEVKKLKKLLATEVKLKEFLVQEIELKSLVPSRKSDSDKGKATVEADKSGKEPVDEVPKEKTTVKKKILLPPYDYGLINSLHDEHKEIRFIFNQLMRFAIDRDYEKVAGRLSLFTKKIQHHYQKADVELYSYLKSHIQQKYPKREKAFTELSLEMKNISIEIFYTISQSPNLPLRDSTHDSFMKEFMHIGKQMNNRINREEGLLFKMYEQTNAAKSIS